MPKAWEWETWIPYQAFNFISDVETVWSAYLTIEFRYGTRVFRRLGWRGQRWTRWRWKLVRVLRASSWPIVLRRIAGYSVAPRWPIVAHRPSHFGLVRHTGGWIQPSRRRQRDFRCWTTKYGANWVEMPLKFNIKEDSFVLLPKF